MMFTCPNCQSPLIDDSKIWHCQNNHVFNVGKNGDVNLLLPQQKRSRFPGDSKAMVLDRRNFLQSGTYQPIAESLSKYVMMLSRATPVVVADAGCGEGYYLRQIRRLCYPHSSSTAQFIGWDISKYATQLAAKQADFGQWLTASNAKIPIVDDGVDILLSLFGFEVAKEFARITQRGGYLITADAGESHLIEIRRLIYPEIKAYCEKRAMDSDGLSCIKQEHLTYQVNLGASGIRQLMHMTPHFFRAKYENIQSLFELNDCIVTVDVMFRIYQVN